MNYGGDCRTAPATPGLLNRKKKNILAERKVKLEYVDITGCDVTMQENYIFARFSVAHS